VARIKIALAGIGNCASSLVQSLYHYATTQSSTENAGLAHPLLGSYTAGDIEVVAAFDIDRRKVDQDLGKAIFAEPNQAPRFAQVPVTKVDVRRAPTLDGITPELRELVHESDAKPVDIAATLKKTGARILVGLLPGGAAEATRYYAQECLKAGVAYINTAPVLLASEVQWAQRFKDAKIIVVGDDLMSQLGSTALHRALIDFLVKRGVHVMSTYQLDVGGGTESLDGIARAREHKRQIKSESVATEIPYEAPVTAGSTDYVHFLENRRESFFNLRGRYVGNAELTLDIRLTSMDAPNSTSILLDIIRAVQIGIDRGFAGPIDEICAYGFKRPPHPIPLTLSEVVFDYFIRSTRPAP
jgi:myo-inositol-1-phosphate synthase